MEWLLKADGGGLPAKNVRPVLSKQLPKGTSALYASPTPKEVEIAIDELGIPQAVREKRKLGKRLYFYFAGHGFGPTVDEVGMLLMDSARDMLNSNLGLRLYRKYFHSAGVFDEVVYIIDCCRDPILYAETLPPRFTAQVRVPTPLVHEFAVLGAAWGEQAFEVSTTGIEPRGLLTQAVLEALKGVEGAKDQSGSGNVTDVSLWKYVEGRVRELATQQDLPQIQNPQVISMSTSMVLARSNASGPVSVHIFNRPDFVGELALLHPNGSTTLEQTPSAQATPWILTLPAGYIYAVDLLEANQQSIGVVPIDTRKRANQTLTVHL
jgi:hypothetical protein